MYYHYRRYIDTKALLGLGRCGLLISWLTQLLAFLYKRCQ
jgi:hypothetical protein